MSAATAPRVLVVMGVSGAGKTTVGKLVAERLGWQFADADDHHPAANVAKMAAGEPLTDIDREPWLERLHYLVTEHVNGERPLVLACSALKNSYRRVIAGEHTRVAFVYLSGSFELIQERLLGRHGHYMPTSLLQSQFDALEEPDDDALRLDVSAAPERLAEEIVERLQLARGAHAGTGTGELSGTAPKGMEFTFRWWGPHDPVPMKHLAQVPNVRTVVTWLGDVAPGQVWSEEAIAQRQAECLEAGLRWTVVESVPVAESIKLASADRDEHIEAFAATITNLGKRGVTTVCYNFMPVFDWMRTDFDYRLPDGSSTVSYSQADLDAIDLSQGLPKLPAWPQAYTAEELQALIGAYEGVTAEEFRERYAYFIRAVAPVAEAAGVKLAIHPDDPPWPIFGLPRIVNDEPSLAALLACSDSPAHGLTFCTGSLGARADNDLPAMVRRFGDRIHFVHARSVERRGEKEFNEVDHTRGAGDVDLVEVMAALVEVGFQGPIRPDHGRMIWGETGIVGYGLYDRALGLMYLQGVHDALTRNGA